MVALPRPNSLTVAAIYASYESNQESGFRPHLGASLIGGECPRQIWYSWRWTTAVLHEGRILRLFQTGHLAEERFVADLRATGVEVHDRDPNTGQQWTIRDSSGHFGGSMDAVALGVKEAPKTWHVCEFKTHSAKSFGKLDREGVQASKPVHYAQMQTYMLLTGMTRALYLAVNKDNDELYAERVRFDAPDANRLLAKAHSIIAYEIPPPRMTEDPTWFQCRFCDHKGACHEGQLPAKHCRSCMFSTPAEESAWVCERHRGEGDRPGLLPMERQLAGCGDHLWIPALIRDEQIDANFEIGWIRYRRPDGTEWQDGIPY